MMDSAHMAMQYDPTQGKMAETRIDIKGEGSFNFKSTRQTVDEELIGYKKHRNSPRKRIGQEGPDIQGRVEFVDEPESGLSPRRHIKIADEIYNIFGSPEDGNIIIVPTNSVVLFDSDLPRIDLDYPERGIHRPSKYPDHDGTDSNNT